MSATKVRSISVGEIPRLKRMFRRALHEDFAYFPGEYIDQVSRDNSVWSFFRAKLSPSRLILGLFDNGRLIGYAVADTRDAHESDIFWFYIIPEKRGQGLGREFFEKLMNSMSQRGSKHVYLITHNQKNFYEAFDFITIGENKGLFDGITMYEMSKEI